MKAGFILRALMILGLSAASQTASAQFGGTLGTKFVCCVAESASCPGGGSATVWSVTLRDRAITQADARARCGFHRMYWGTHSCPQDTGCSGSSDPGPAQQWITVKNSCNRGVTSVAAHYRSASTGRWVTDGYWNLQPGQTASIGPTNNGIFYYWAKNYSANFSWEGDKYWTVNGSSLGFRQKNGYNVNLTCN